MAEWMVNSFGHPMDYITEPDVRDKWLRDNGLLYQFICAHFPENARAVTPGEKGEPLK